MKKYLTLIILVQTVVSDLAMSSAGYQTLTEDNYPRVIECAYLIGSFNDWDLPEGDDLNGAKKIEYHPLGWGASDYRLDDTFPAGDVSFMIYVPESANLTDVDYSGFYTSQCQQFPLYKPDRDYLNTKSHYSWCERSAELDINKACKIPDWSEEEVRIWFSICPEDYIDGEGYQLQVDGFRRPVPTPEHYYFITSVDGGEPEIVSLVTCRTNAPRPYYEFTYWGVYSGRIDEMKTVSGYFSSVPSLNADPAKCLGACGPDELTLDPAEYGTGYEPLGESEGILFLSPGKNPITINIIGGGHLYIPYLNILNWTVEFWASKTPGSVDGVSVDSSNQIVISDHSVTVPSPTQIDVYGLGGVKVRSGYGTRLDLCDLARGTYIVRAAGLSRKVAL